MSKLKIEDTPGLVRDTRSGAIIVSDSNRINKAKEIKRLRKAQLEKVDNLAEEVESLHNEVSEIKQLLIQLVEKNNG